MLVVAMLVPRLLQLATAQVSYTGKPTAIKVPPQYKQYDRQLLAASTFSTLLHRPPLVYS